MATRQAVDFNNAAVICIRARLLPEAIDLLKGSTECVFEQEQENTKSFYVWGHPQTREQLVRRAHEQLLQMPLRLKETCVTPKAGAGDPIGDDYYILDRPFPVEVPITVADRTRAHSFDHAKRTTAAVIFNLALAFQLQNRNSRRAISLYKLVTTILAGDTTSFMSLAVTNNIGVYCVDNHEYDLARLCFERVYRVLLQSPVLRDEERRGLVSNVAFLLVPSPTRSPAA